MLDPQFRRGGQKVGDRTPPPGKAADRLKCWIDLANLLKDFNPVAAAQAAGREIRILEAVGWAEFPERKSLRRNSPVTPFLLRELERRFRAPRTRIVRSKNYLPAISRGGLAQGCKSTRCTSRFKGLCE